jgi:hypothetical protein
MHSTSRLLACRVGFVLFCLLPTLIVGGWIVRRNLPDFRLAQKTEWERELSQRLGVTVTLGELQYPAPDLAVLTDVQLANPETGEPIATVSDVELARTDAGWSVELEQPQIDVAQFAQFGSALHDRLLRALGDTGGTITFKASSTTLHRGDLAVTLVRMAGELDPRVEMGPRLSMDYSLAESPAEAVPSTLTVVRNRHMRPPVTRWQLDSRGVALPCWLAVDALPQLAHLGPHASFVGQADWMQTSEGLHARLAGTLLDVDLDLLVSAQFPHQLSGVASISLEPVVVENGRLVELRGGLQAANGWVSPSLLRSAEEHLGLAVPGPLKQAGNQPVTFRQLSLGFHLDNRRLLLTGGCDPTRDGVAMANAGGPIVEVPPGHATAALNLLRTLLPHSDWQVPAARQTSSLVALLPLPDAAPTTAAQRASHVPTRLVPPGSAAPDGIPVRQPQ